MATGLRSNVESRRKRTQSRGPLFFAILLKLERQQWSSRRKAACTLSHDSWPAGRQTEWHSTIRTRARAHSPMRTPVPAWLQGWEGGERASIRPKPIQLLPPCGACRPAREQHSFRVRVWTHNWVWTGVPQVEATPERVVVGLRREYFQSSSLLSRKQLWCVPAAPADPPISRRKTGRWRAHTPAAVRSADRGGLTLACAGNRWVRKRTCCYHLPSLPRSPGDMPWILCWRPVVRRCSWTT